MTKPPCLSIPIYHRQPPNPNLKCRIFRNLTIGQQALWGDHLVPPRPPQRAAQADEGLAIV
jgi:hypothetical protein